MSCKDCKPTPDVLDALQRQIVVLCAQGHTISQVAVLVGLSFRGASGQIQTIYDRLGIHDRVRLTLWAIRCGLIEP